MLMRTPLPLEDDAIQVFQFDTVLRDLVLRMNGALGSAYMSVEYEGRCRWSLMGSDRAEWYEAELLDARTFRVVKILGGACMMTCKFRKNGSSMESDVSNALRMMVNFHGD